MLKAIYHFATQDLAFMYAVLYQTPYFFFDYWSFNHFFTGILIIMLARRCSAAIRGRWACLLALLVGWEALEIGFIYISLHVFRPETIPDQVTDIVIGILGGLAVEGWHRWRLSRRNGLVPMRTRDLA